MTEPENIDKSLIDVGDLLCFKSFRDDFYLVVKNNDMVEVGFGDDLYCIAYHRILNLRDFRCERITAANFVANPNFFLVAKANLE